MWVMIGRVWGLLRCGAASIAVGCPGLVLRRVKTVVVFRAPLIGPAGYVRCGGGQTRPYPPDPWRLWVPTQPRDPDRGGMCERFGTAVAPTSNQRSGYRR